MNPAPASPTPAEGAPITHVQVGPGGTVRCVRCGDTSQLPTAGTLRGLFEAGAAYFAAHEGCSPREVAT